MLSIVQQKSSQLFYSPFHSETISFPPALAQAQVALWAIASYEDFVIGARVRIIEFTHRPTADGMDETVQLPFWPGDSIVGIVERMTSVTWLLESNPKTSAEARIDILWWGDVTENKASSIGPVALDPGLAGVVYESRTGDVHFVHEEISLPGAQVPDPTQVELRALAVATPAATADLGDLEVLLIPGQDLRGRRRFRVDAKRRMLVDSD